MNWDHNLEEPPWFHTNNPYDDPTPDEELEWQDKREAERAVAVEHDADYWQVYEDDPYEDEGRTMLSD